MQIPEKGNNSLMDGRIDKLTPICPLNIVWGL